MPRSGSAARCSAIGALLAAGVAAAVWTRVDGLAHPGPVGVTWTGTVARLLAVNCVSCHSEGGARPRLDEYESARASAGAIKQAVLGRHMPLWYAAGRAGDFANDPTLTPYETELLAQWADGRAPLSASPASAASAPPMAAGAAPAPPDLVLSVRSKYRIVETAHTFRLPSGLDEPRWIRGWAFRPGNPALITGAVVAVEGGGTLGTWVPGEDATLLPDGITKPLPAGAAIHLTVFYRTQARPAVDASAVGLYFADRPGRKLEHMALPCGTSRLPAAIDVLAVRPAIGSSAGSLSVLARRAGMAVERLGSFRDYPGDHPRTYWFRRAVTLPRGAALDVHADHGACRAELEFVRAAGGLTTPAVSDRRERAGSPAPGGPQGYWCPMHSNVRAATRGVCTQCGMALTPVAPEVEGPYRLEVDEVGPTPGPGGYRTLRLVVREPRTNAIVRRFETVHERPFHLFLISEDLSEFHHVHPVAQPDGSLELSPVPLRSGPYHVYADFLPTGGTPQMIHRTVIPARLAHQWNGDRAARLSAEPGDRTDGDLRVRMALDDGVVIAGTPSLIDFHLEDAVSAAPVADLEPYLGAWGHVFIVSADGADAVHSHPLTPLASPGGPSIVFQQRFPRAGTYRVWAQFMRNGRVATVSFTVIAKGHVHDA
jgi:hypothetical protein